MAETADVVSGGAKVVVDLGSRSYDILIERGSLRRAGAEIAKRAPQSRAAIVTDETVARLHLPALAQALAAAGIDHVVTTVAPGEASKSFPALERVVDALLAARLERNDVRHRAPKRFVFRCVRHDQRPGFAEASASS